MKFLCDNCKAKYQIGDDKVAGKTVRMKCRRCGHLIQVSASVTESSVARRLPTEPGPQSSSSPKPISSAKPAHPGPLFDASGDVDESTVIRSDDPPSSDGRGPASRPGVGVPRPIASARDTAAQRLPPRPGAPAPAPVRPATPPRPVAVPRPPVAAVPRTLASAPRAVGGAATASRPALAPVPALAPEPPPAPPGALGAFPGADQPAPSETRPGATSTEDWYVGVSGVPLGPIRTSVIREKAAAGAVDGESLVWREGFDEWLPLKKFPELLEIVNEARTSSIGARRSSGPAGHPAPQPFGPSSAAARAAPGRDTAATPTSGAAVSPTFNREAPAAPLGGAAVSPTFNREAPAAPLGGAAASPTFNREAPAAPLGGAAASPTFNREAPAAPLGGAAVSPTFNREAPPPAPAPFAAPASAASSAGAAFGAAPAEAPTRPAPGVDVLADPFGPGSQAREPVPAAAGFAGASAGAAPQPTLQSAPVALAPAPDPRAFAGGRPSVSDDDYVPPRRRMHPMAYALIAMAAVFGGVAAFVLLSPKPPPPAPQIVVLQQGPAPVAVAQAPQADGDAGVVEIQVGDPAAVQARSNPGGPWPVRSADPKAPAAPLDTSGFGSPSTASGTTPVGPSTSTAPPSGLGQLTQGEISGVVESNRAGIRKRCWQPALDGRPKGGPSNARVSASIVIGPAGNVESVSAGGAESTFPGLSSCIAGRIKSWKFPPSSGSSPVNVPFFFAEQ